MNDNQTFEVARFAVGLPFVLLHVVTITVLIKGRRRYDVLKSSFFKFYIAQSFVDIQYYISVRPFLSDHLIALHQTRLAICVPEVPTSSNSLRRTHAVRLRKSGLCLVHILLLLPLRIGFVHGCQQISCHCRPAECRTGILLQINALFRF